MMYCNYNYVHTSNGVWVEISSITYIAYCRKGLCSIDILFDVML